MARRPVPDPGGSSNARTVESYEQIADDYARETAGASVLSGGLTRLAETVPAGHALEIGSGPGWDADALEKAGLTVRRTDITQAFIDFQRARGKEIDRLDAINDDLGGTYDAVVALHVLQHVEPDDLPAVLAKVCRGLAPGRPIPRLHPLGRGCRLGDRRVRQSLLPGAPVRGGVHRRVGASWAPVGMDGTVRRR